jgi:hypothetical protein
VKQISKRFTYANVMSSIAVFLVLGGGAAFAAGQLGKNSVGSKQLKKNAVTTAKIKNGAITGAKVKAGSLGASSFAAGQLPAGPKGEKGDKGDPGPSFGAYGSDSCGGLEKEEEEIEAYESCASTGSVNLPSSGNVLLIASAEWDNDDTGGAPPNSGQCRLSVDGSPLPDGVSFGEETDTHGIGEGGSISMNQITTQLSAGAHSFDLECQETAGTAYIAEATISAVLLGSASLNVPGPM